MAASCSGRSLPNRSCRRNSSASRVPFTAPSSRPRSEEHTSELQSPCNLVCRLLLEKKKNRHPALTPSTVIQSDTQSLSPRRSLPRHLSQIGVPSASSRQHIFHDGNSHSSTRCTTAD